MITDWEKEFIEEIVSYCKKNNIKKEDAAALFCMTRWGNNQKNAQRMLEILRENPNMEFYEIFKKYSVEVMGFDADLFAEKPVPCDEEES